MSERAEPEWFRLSEQATPEIMQRLANSLEKLDLPLQVKSLPMQAHWFLLDSVLLANRANREGMHANALAIIRQCIEAISVIEVGLSRTQKSVEMLHCWENDEITSGNLRKWLEKNNWGSYGCGLWHESWAEFMGKLAQAVQPYAHYSPKLAQWQLRLHEKINPSDSSLIVEFRPRAYDPQKATRITLFHALIVFTLSRIWLATRGSDDHEFAALINRFRLALGKSKYLDGQGTVWEQQFWATMIFKDGRTTPE